MNDRAFTLAGAIVALIAVYVLLGGGPAGTPTASRPHTKDTRSSGLAGLARWLDSEQVPVFSLSRRYDLLHSEETLPATGNLLIMSMPHFTPARVAESEYLDEWIAQGNSVLVLASLYNVPPWALAAYARGNYAWWMVNELLPVDIESEWIDEESEETETADDETDAPRDTPIEHDKRYLPVGAHPLLDRVPAIQRSAADVDSEIADWLADTRVVVTAQAPVLTLMAGETTGEAALWLTPYGQGRIIVSALPEVFSNRALAQPGHAQLAANIVNYALDGGHVIFDDMHQGISTLYDPDAFFSDSRLYKSLAFMIALWLAWLLGASSRFYLGDGRETSAPSRAAFIEATGSFLARSLRPVTCARELFTHFFADLRRTGRYRGDTDLLWRRLAADAGQRPEAVAELRAAHARLDSGSRRIDPRRIHNLMQALRKDLL